MKKYEALSRVIDEGLVGIIRTNTYEEAIRVTEACLLGGIKTLEVTFTVPKAHKIIEELNTRYQNEDILLGAGTVLDSESARTAILSGAEFIVSPSINIETIKLCNRYSKLCLPGVMNLKEIVKALEYGVDIVKVFPAGVLGKEFIKAVKAPLPQVLLMPTGGVSLENAKEWLEVGCTALGVGGSLTVGSKSGDYNKVTETARAFRKIVDDFKINNK